jgi:hypothetical protein
MTQDDLYKAWHSVGADIAGLNFSDFVSYLPAQRPWVGLTDEFLRRLHHVDQFGLFCDYDDFEQIARAIEAAHGIKEKNT